MKGAAAAAGLGIAGVRRADAKPARTPVEHIVVVMMENRSVDHFLGWYGKENPDFDGIQDAHFVDQREGRGGARVGTEDWGRDGRNDFDGRGFADPDHGWDNGRLVVNGGRMDGWLHPKTGNDELTLATYEAHDVPVWAQLTRGWQTYDHWHSALLGPTQPNRYYLHSGQSGGLKDNSLPPELAGEHPEWALGWDWPTIWTLLDRFGVTGAYYFSNLPQLAFWGARHLNRTRHISEFYAAAAAGQLPQVCFIDPWYIAPAGISNDDHPHADIRLGQAFLSDVIGCFENSPQYRESAMVVTYDEWGGFWDHVPPPRFADDRGTPADPGGQDDFGQSGFRIPSTIISPWTRRPGAVDHTVYDHTSIIKFIAQNWGLPFLTKRQRETNSIGAAFGGFANYNPDPVDVSYEVPLHVVLEPTLESLAKGIGGGAAGSSTSSSDIAVSDIYRLAETGWLDQFPIKLDHRFEDSFARSIKPLVP